MPVSKEVNVFVSTPPRPVYRADIDGLRGIAVGVAIGYHAFPEWFKGGFIGVDVFFVISGFLISGILLKSLQQGDLNIIAFYARRVKRIFPAVLVVLFSLLLMGWFTLFADEYQQLGKHVAATAAFISNFVFWKEIGYFDNAVSTKLLLHSWSLAVEEQFYLVWPVFIWLASKARMKIWWSLTGVTISSFIYGVWLTQNGGSSAFYLPHARFWELALGSLLAYHSLDSEVLAVPGIKQKTSFKNILTNIQPTLGLFLIVYAVVMFSHDQTYPGWRAVIPTTGALLIVAAGPHAWLNRVILSKRILVAIGLISYPMYLWHWPLLSLSHIIVGGTPSLELKLAMIALSIVLAGLTYRWVEVPLRFGCANQIKVPLLVGAMVAVGGLGWLTFNFDGFPQRLPNTTSILSRVNDWEYPSHEMKSESLAGVPVQTVGGQGNQTLFYGDSTVEQYGPRVAELLGNNSGLTRGAIFLTRGGDIPIDRIRRIDGYLTSTDNFFKVAASQNIDRVVIGAAWSLYFNRDKSDLGLLDDPVPHYFAGDISLEESQGRQVATDRLTVMVNQLTKQGKSVYLLASSPGGKEFGRNAITKSRKLFLKDLANNDENQVPRKQIEKRLSIATEFVTDIANRTGATLINPMNYLCSTTQCPVDILKDIGHLRASFVRHQLKYLDATVLESVPHKPASS